jgi:hypothetical protein
MIIIIILKLKKYRRIRSTINLQNGFVTSFPGGNKAAGVVKSFAAATVALCFFFREPHSCFKKSDSSLIFYLIL